MVVCMHHTVILLYLLLIPVVTVLSTSSNHGETPEAIFRRTVAQWRSGNSARTETYNYSPWNSFTEELLERFESAAGADKEADRLELVGAVEEGILMIEKTTRYEGDNVNRDAALSTLYAGYGQILLNLTPNECHALALDPHTLLIGAETVKKASSPSVHLCIENAENALRNAATLDATNADAQELLHQVTNSEEGVHTRKPKEFVAELFDSFADTFDDKLVKGLGYKVPQFVGNTAKELLLEKKDSHYEAVLDAGCGTGLAGRFLSPLLKSREQDGKGGVLIGVDASQKMLDIAAKCTVTSGCGLKVDDRDGGHPLYDGLLVLDLEEMTHGNTLRQVVGDDNKEVPIVGFDLIVAADVLVYFGNLENLLMTFATVSTDDGAALVFTCERATDEEAPLGWRLLPSGRFAHTKQHAVEAAAKVGYELVKYEEIVPRTEKGEEVKGHLFGFVLTNKKTAQGHTEL